MQIRIRKHSQDLSGSCSQRSKNLSPSKNSSPSFDLTLKIWSSVKWHFISQNFKSPPTAIHPDYFIFPKSRFRDSSLSEVHFLYSPKNTALSTLRHVGDSATPATEMVSVSKCGIVLSPTCWLLLNSVASDITCSPRMVTF
ncbi:hypothetical protein AVEN_40402-1 [Araneus ventricosus]|uniref:Uncharacterized protein n=1 Tax=Araneus ventricosus TaxID=182803 RepID=A0A4Y2D9T6_ARAVE|nr:hypothetical protein AVEN_40402-1 [Araneus ventricosus]